MAVPYPRAMPCIMYEHRLWPCHKVYTMCIFYASNAYWEPDQVHTCAISRERVETTSFPPCSSFLPHSCHLMTRVTSSSCLLIPPHTSSCLSCLLIPPHTSSCLLMVTL